MKRILVSLLLPFLVVLLIFESFGLYISNQNCQVGIKKLNDSCCCSSIQELSNNNQVDTCCCVRSNSLDNEKTYLFSGTKFVEFNFISDLEFTSSFELTPKINLIENYSAYFSAGFSTSEELVLYSPPIYQQICSLRI